MTRSGWWIGSVSLWAACSTAATDVAEDTDTDTAPEVTVLGSCVYTNLFSDGEECKEFTGSAWTETTATESCGTASIAASAGVFTAGQGCSDEGILGRCVVASDDNEDYVLYFPGTDAASCSGVAIGCGFAQGTFEPAPICDGEDPGPGPSGTVFQPFELSCVEPLEGEPAGASEGEVCTWGAISACTEEGRRFQDYGSCEAVLSQRPYAPYEVTAGTDPSDPRYSDATWQVEADWVTAQVEACACTCCHSSELAPDGPAGWYLEAEGLWIDTLDDDGLAMLAGWIDSTAFGAFPPEDNNGFDRQTTGLPTTDIPRMVAFLEGELERRGLERSDFADAEPFGGVLYDQLFYDAPDCTGGEGVDADGVVTWKNGRVRYVYVLEEGSNSPGVPPNLDTPAGTVWRLDVRPEADGLASGITYGSAPAGSFQAFPAAGAPDDLIPGTRYYLVALKDVYQPLTRCVFVAE